MRGLVSALILALAVPAGAAQPRPRYEIPRVETELKIDGHLDEPAWHDALVFELEYETDPGENVAAPVRTVCRLFYSPSHLYYGCHAFDPEPAKIRARYADRDLSFPTDDVIGIALDPFNSRNRAFVFDVNPLGVQNDRVFTEASQVSDATWDALWDSAGRLVDDGYVVEVAIPFSSLRFPRREGEQIWGFNFRRYIPREVFRRVAIVPYDRSDPCRLCQEAELAGFEGVDPGKNLEVTPTITGVRISERVDFPDGELRSADPDIEPGLSVRWGVTSNLQLAATLNPDFSQVEADVAQLDVNEQFALFFPELRPFFLEGNEFFRTPRRAIFTRTLADPAWGIKLTGKQGPHALGAFVVRDERTNFLFPGFEGSDAETLLDESTTSVVRYARDLGGNSSTLGLVATDRRGGDYSNSVAGVDAFLRFGTEDVVEVQILRSRTDYPDQLALDFGQPLDSFDGDALLIGYEHDPRSWTIGASYQDVDDGFRADTGFIPRVGFREAEAWANYEWFGDADNWYTRIEVGGDWERSETQSGFLIDQSVDFYAGFNGQAQSSVWLEVDIGERSFEGVIFDDDSVRLYAFARPARAFEAGVEIEVGDGIDFEEVRQGDQVELEAWVRTKLGRHFKADLLYTREELDIDAGELFTADLGELRLVYQINSRSFLRLIAQYFQVDRDPSLFTEPVEASSDALFGQFLFAYRLDARTALWVGYTANYLDEADSGLTESGNAIFFKVSYAWQP